MEKRTKTESIVRRSTEVFLEDASLKFNNIKKLWSHCFKNRKDEDLFVESLTEVLVAVDTLKEVLAVKNFKTLTDLAIKMEQEFQRFFDVRDESEFLTISMMMTVFGKQLSILTGAEKLEGYIDYTLTIMDRVVGDKGNTRNKIILVSEDQDILEQFKNELSFYGYSFDVLSPEKYEELNRDVLTPVVIDLESLTNHNVELADVIGFKHKSPVVVLGEQEDFKTRLHVAKFNVMSFLVKPSNVLDILDKIENLRIRDKDIGYRVLIVDDSSRIGRFVTRRLTAKGMEVDLETDPENAIESINRFDPDLILIDVHLPHSDFNGDELTKIIRQHESFSSIPVMLMASEDHIGKEVLDLEEKETDVFLMNKINTDEIIEKITEKIEKYRELHDTLNKDGLTGLFNKNATLKYFNDNVSKANDFGLDVSLLMIDFKSYREIIGRHGSAVGDMFLKSFAKLLKANLRKTDIIGRTNGSEFAIVLWDANLENTKEVIKRISDRFNEFKNKWIYDIKDIEIIFSKEGYPNLNNVHEIWESANKDLSEKILHINL